MCRQGTGLTLTVTPSRDYWALLLEFWNIPSPDQPDPLPGLDSEAPRDRRLVSTLADDMWSADGRPWPRQKLTWGTRGGSPSAWHRPQQVLRDCVPNTHPHGAPWWFKDQIKSLNIKLMVEI